MNDTAEGYMADVRADLGRIWLADKIPDPERLECFWRIAREAGNLLNETLGKMRRTMPEEEIVQIIHRMDPPTTKRRRSRARK